MAGGLMVSQVLGSQRSLLDRVVIRNAKKMPMTALIKKGPSVDNMMYEWPLDIYDDAKANAIAEGKDVDAFDNQAKNYVVIANRVQWVRRPWMVGKLAQDVQNQAGISDKRAYQVKKALDHLMQDIEAAICSDNDVVAGSGALPDQARAMGTWISSAITTSGYTVDSNYLPAAAQIFSSALSGLTDDSLNTLLRETWLRGGAPQDSAYKLVCGATLRATISGLNNIARSTNYYAPVRTYSVDASKKILYATIDTFQGDFGQIELLPTHWNAHANVGGSAAANLRRGYGINPEKWDIVWKQMPKNTDLPDLGGGPRGAVDAIIGLRCHDPAANFKISSTS